MRIVALTVASRNLPRYDGRVLKRGYEGQDCSVARALEIVGERWTLLIVRDLMLGVTRFTDLLRHLDVPRGVLAERLEALDEHGVIERRPEGIALTARGEELWPVLHALMQWGEGHYVPAGRVRSFRHAACGTELQPGGECPACALTPSLAEVETRPGPGADPTLRDDDVTLALRRPRRMLEPVRG